MKRLGTIPPAYLHLQHDLFLTLYISKVNALRLVNGNLSRGGVNTKHTALQQGVGQLRGHVAVLRLRA